MINVLCYGDSNTWGFIPVKCERYDEEVRWAGRIKKLLGENYNVIEEGCNGRTCVFDDPYEEWKNGLTYLKPCLNSHKPIDIVVLMLGSNDLKKHFNVNAEQIASGAEQLVKTILEFTKEKQEKPAKVLLISPPEIGEDIGTSMFNYDFPVETIETSRQFKKYYGEVAVRNGCEFMAAADYVVASKLDSLHLDPEEHEKLAVAVADKLKKICE